MPPTFDARVRALGRQLAVVAAALSLVTCTDNPTGPTVGSTFQLAVTPRFKAGTFLSPALPVDQVSIVVYRSANCDCAPDSIAGATAPFALTDSAVTLRVPVQLLQRSESLSVQVSLIGGGQILFQGSEGPVVVTAGGVPAAPVVAMSYVGPGSALDSLRIAPRDSVLTFGDSLTFAVEAFQLGSPVPAFYVGWSSSLGAAKVLPDGRIRAPGVRGKTVVTARAPNGRADSTTLTFVPKPATLTKVSGDTQTATKGDTLPLPLRVRVRATDTLGVAGVRVVYQPLGSAGPAVPDTAVTDSLGYAQVRAVLADSVGTQQWSATVAGLPPVTFSATAQVVAGPPFRLRFTTEPGDTQVNGALVTPAPVVQVVDSAGIAVKQSGIAIDLDTYSFISGSPRPARRLLRRPAGPRGTGPALSNRTFGVTTDTTDAQGKATFSALRVTGYGQDRLVVNASSLPLIADTSVDIFIKEGPPKSLGKGSADSSSSYVDSLVTVLPAVVVYDTTFNQLPNIPVVFQVTAGGGQLSKPVDTVFTDSTGRATLGFWRLGPTPGTNTVQATVAGAGSLTFTVFAQPPVPTILLQLQGTSVVGVGRTALLQVKLSSPAGVNGDTLTVTSSNPSIITASPSTLVVPAGDSIVYDTLTGVAAGVDTISVAATGYVTGVLPVTASLNLISLPTTLTVPFGGTSNISVTLGAPAPAGGVVVTLTSSDTTKVGIQTPTVSFAQGEITKSGTLTGVALGSATITASNPNYAGDQAAATTAANLDFVASSATIYPAFPDTQTIRFLSQGSPIAAPAGGVVVTLAAADPACVNVPANATITAGLTNVLFMVNYAGSAPTPCTSWVYATAPGVGGDSVSITVANPPAINLPTGDVGAGLQQGVTASLGTMTTAPLTLRIRPLALGIAQFAPNDTTAGSDSLSIAVPSGVSYVNATVSGVDSIVNDSVKVEVSMTGFQTDTVLVRVRQAAVKLFNVPTTTTTFSASTSIYATIGVPNLGFTAIQAYQRLRVGHAPVTATFTVTPGSVATLTDSVGALDTVRSAVIPALPGRYSTPTSIASGGVGYHPLSAGSTTTAVTIPGFITLGGASSTLISAPTTSMSGNMQVGSGLQNTASLYLAVAAPTATTATVRSLKPSILILSDSNTTVGADSVVIPIDSGQSSKSFFLQSPEGVTKDSTQMVLSVPGYTPDTMWVYVRQPGVQLANLPTTTTTFTARSQFYALIGVPNATNTALYAYQAIRPGGSPLTVTFHTAPDSVGKLTDSTGVLDTVRTAVIPVGPNQYLTPTSVASGGVAYQPAGPGTSTTWATIPGFVHLPADTVQTVVSAPAISVYSATVGSGLQVGNSIYLGAPVPAADTVVIRSLAPNVLKVALNDSTPGTDSVVAVIGAGATGFSYYVQGVEGVVNDSALVSVTIAGFAPGQAWSYVRQAAVQLTNVNTNVTTLTDSAMVTLVIGVPYAGNTGMYQYQALRAGSSGASFVVKVSNPSVQAIATSGGRVDSVVVPMVARQVYSPSTVAAGGLALKALTTGVDTVRASGASFVSLPAATVAVTVSTPTITVYPPSYGLGSGLQYGGSFQLGAYRHGGVNVVVKSSQPSVMLVAPNDTTPGSDSIVVFVPDGQSSGSYVLQAIDSMVGTPVLTVSAPGFVDKATAITVMQPGITIYGVPATISAASPDQAIYAYIGVPNVGNSGLNQFQSRRAGASTLVVTFDASNPAAATLADSAGTGTPRTALIPPGKYYSPTSVATGGVAVHPVAPGTSTISTSTPGFIQVTSASALVTVSP